MKKTYIYSILAALLLAVVAFLFFFPDDMEGNVLRQHDTMQGIANGQEGKAFHEATGETTRWTNSLFSGMPNFQIAPSYPADEALSFIGRAFSLWLPAPANLLFAMMLGFFIMALCFNFRWYTALFAAVAWGFSSYFIIIIGAGHIWKFATLAYIPPTIGGIALCYRGKYLAGTGLAALFGALQLHSNHPQMSYYFGIVIIALVLAWLYSSIRKHTMKRWSIATLCCIIAGVLALAVNSPSLYSSYEYSKETVRGKATEIPASGMETAASGMDRDAITAWSYGLDETFSLLIPDVKGGATIKPVGGQNQFLSVAQTDKADELSLPAEVRTLLGQFPQYFGDQPMTNGPVYVGSFVLLLAILALFVVDSPIKWALFLASLLAIMLSWGHNFAPLTNFFIDHVPGYNKFRAVASILVVVEFCVPFLAALCIRKMIQIPDFFERNKWTIYGVFGFGALVCLIGWMMPSVFGSAFSASEVKQLGEAGVLNNPDYAPLWDAVRSTRYSLVQADCLRSFLFIALGFGVLMLWFKKAFRGAALFVCCLTAVALIDLFPLNKRYVDSESFTAPFANEAAFEKSEADKAILADTAMNYRVMDYGNFSEARSSYFHKTIGGYHAAKLTRYNDLITHQISKGNPEVLNMLNARYFLNGNEYQQNPGALGNAWIVDSIVYVDTPAQEMAALDTIQPGRYAVADNKFKSVLGIAKTKLPGDTIFETTYAPNKLTYHANTAEGGLAVFSEVYFPWGWKATVDGNPVEIGRVDYVLRAMQLPAGSHTVEFVFDPESVKTTQTLSMISLFGILGICGIGLVLWVIHLFIPSGTESGKSKE